MATPPPFISALVRWFRAGHRDMHWRKTRDPYAIWVSESMLQQTQVATVIPYFNRFIARFPDVSSLATAPLEDVLEHWKGLGYYARARNLQRAAQVVVERFSGKIPESEEGLMSLPGVGRYTAGAIRSIAFDQPAPLLDGNVSRVFCRIFCLDLDPREPKSVKLLWAKAASLVPEVSAGDYNQALMELGATVCTPSRPSCKTCPIEDFCGASRLPDPTVLPRVAVARARSTAKVVALLVERPDGAILFGKRPNSGLLGGMWEMPALVVEEKDEEDSPGEPHLRPKDPQTTPRRASKGKQNVMLAGIPTHLDLDFGRVARLRLGLELTSQHPTVKVQFKFTHLELELFVRRVMWSDVMLALPLDAPPRVPKPTGLALSVQQLQQNYDEYRWIEPHALKALPTGKATQRALETFEGMLRFG